MNCIVMACWRQQKASDDAIPPSFASTERHSWCGTAGDRARTAWVRGRLRQTISPLRLTKNLQQNISPTLIYQG